MATNKQIEANRRNAQLSTGPISEEGKAIVSRNAMKHGIFTREIYLNDSIKKDFLALKERLYEELQPEGYMEEMLLDRVICAAWRLSLIVQIEAEIIEGEAYDRPFRSSEPLSIRWPFVICSKETMGLVSRYETHLERSFYKALSLLRELQEKRRLMPERVETIVVSSKNGFVS